ncbi:hypothetical protein FBEOM_14700 [Fusarium beomiforme]|uniref:Uncharacterized protein n=1 Tax=Fusarium beomiforme TaxID=44412 RepID=A0A9P5A4T3_9HYPO|nr:hypothetical protein FBEOM_14700 [Fusarium beomiforme]
MAVIGVDYGEEELQSASDTCVLSARNIYYSSKNKRGRTTFTLPILMPRIPQNNSSVRVPVQPNTEAEVVHEEEEMASLLNKNAKRRRYGLLMSDQAVSALLAVNSAKTINEQAAREVKMETAAIIEAQAVAGTEVAALQDAVDTEAAKENEQIAAVLVKKHKRGESLLKIEREHFAMLEENASQRFEARAAREVLHQVTTEESEKKLQFVTEHPFGDFQEIHTPITSDVEKISAAGRPHVVSAKLKPSLDLKTNLNSLIAPEIWKELLPSKSEPLVTESRGL